METQKNSFRIKKIRIDKLFGHYTYVLTGSDIDDNNKLMIFYGDNGSGKTTILKLLFYLLATRDNSGYKTKIAKIRFERYVVYFEGGLEIGVERNNGKLIGSFNFFIREPDKILQTIYLKAEQDNSIRIHDDQFETKEKYYDILYYLKSLNMTVFFLTDTRQILDSRSLIYENKILKPDFFNAEVFLDKLPDNVNKIKIKPVIDNLSDWIQNKYIASSNLGEKDTNTIYTGIIKSVLEPQRIDNDIIEKKTLISDLKELIIKIEDFEKYGFISAPEYSEIYNLINKSVSDNLKLASKVIIPFKRSIEAKLGALTPLKNIIYELIKTINSNFLNKTISYNISEGFTLLHKKEFISFEDLSSGEKQFLLLLCNTITSKEKATFFIIDEPEISLNVKWQRKLLKTLLNFGKNNDVQFIVATHSIELLTSHRDNLVKLKNLQ